MIPLAPTIIEAIRLFLVTFEPFNKICENMNVVALAKAGPIPLEDWTENDLLLLNSWASGRGPIPPKVNVWLGKVRNLEREKQNETPN